MAKRPSSTRTVRRRPDWTGLKDEELLDIRICDLGLRLADLPLAKQVADLQAEFVRRDLDFRPYAWLSTDWFTPDGLTGFAVPFYLAHPRLVRLERKQMLEVEGGTAESCRRIMRHEAAHAFDNAYGLHQRKDWRETFGRFSTPYTSSYSPDPSSRDYVLHLYSWYSQSHPAEDYAETFAVWLAPGSRWRSRYAGWGALRKLEYIDRLAKELRGVPPKLRTRRFEEPIASVRMTLREYYEDKHRYYADESTPAFDGQLLRLFSEEGDERHPTAVSFLRQYRRALVRHIIRVTGQHAYLVDHVIGEVIRRCKSRRLRLLTPPDEALVDTAVLVTSLTLQYLHSGHHRYQR